MVVLFESLNRHENLNDSRNYCEFGVVWGLVPKHPPPPRQILPVVPQLIMPIKLVVPRDGVDAMRVEKVGDFVARFI